MTKYKIEYAQQYEWSGNGRMTVALYYTIFVNGVAVISTYEDLYDDYYMRSTKSVKINGITHYPLYTLTRDQENKFTSELRKEIGIYKYLTDCLSKMDGGDHEISYILKVDDRLIDKYRTKAQALREGYNILWKEEIQKVDCEDPTFMNEVISRIDPNRIVVKETQGFDLRDVFKHDVKPSKIETSD